MEREEVKAVFKFIKEVYPQFEVTSDKLTTWTRLLKDQNPAIIMRNVEKYSLENKFPPSVADLREKQLEAYSNNHLERVRQWRSEAVGYNPRSGK